MDINKKFRKKTDAFLIAEPVETELNNRDETDKFFNKPW